MLKFLLAIFFIFHLPCFSVENGDPLSHRILVSVAPHKHMVEKIAGGTVQVDVMVPAGASAHTFEPSPKQMIHAGKADLWFHIGEGFETRAIAALKAHNPRMQLVDLRKNLNLISSSCCCHPQRYHESCLDLHFWLSPQMDKQQAQVIAETLIRLYPQHQDLYKKNLNVFLSELDSLDQEITKLFQAPHNSTIMVSHPAYAYFCRDYGCEQLSIELEGKDPTPQQLTKILQLAREKGIKVIFIQPQYSSKGARLIAREIDAEVVSLDPYAENFIDGMRQIAKAFVTRTR